MDIATAQQQIPVHKSRLATLTYLTIGLLMLLFLLETFVAERWWWTTFLAYMPQHPFIVPSLLLGLITLLRKQWVLAGWNLLAVACGLLLLLGVNIPLRFGTPEGMPLRVMTWNVHHASGGVRQLEDAVAQEKPDILCLQEVNDERTGKYSPALRTVFSGWHRFRGEETAIFSRYPIVEQHIYPLPSLQRVLLEAVVEVQGRRFTIINVHISTSTTQESLTTRSGSVRAYLRQTAVVRAAQCETVRNLAARSPHPVIIAGDFNTPPRGVLYRRFSARYPDAFVKAGWGAGYTYPARLPILRIDHCFVDTRIAVVRCRRAKVAGSDHYPLVSDLVF